MQLPAATTAVVVTTPEVSAIRDADRIIGLTLKKTVWLQYTCL